jgi:hypothetical protein
MRGRWRDVVVLAATVAAVAGCSTAAPPSPARLPLPYASPSAFHEAVLALYDFHPPQLSPEEREQKTRALDAFWQRCELDPDTCLPRLRAELRAPATPPFFFYDGAKLLLKMSRRADDRRLALQAIARSDVRDLAAADYLATVHALAVEGFDTTEAAFHILSVPDFTAVVPPRGLQIGPDYSLVFMLMPTDERFFLPRAIARLDLEADELALRSLLLLVWYAGTEEGDAAIARVAEAGPTPRVREYAASMKNRTSMLRTDPRVGDFIRMNFPRLESPSPSEIRELRRVALNRISDEALLQFDALTIVLRRTAST